MFPQHREQIIITISEAIINELLPKEGVWCWCKVRCYEGLCYRSSLQNDDRKQESIQVGCVPSAAAAVCWGASGPGGSCSRGDVCSGERCLLLEGGCSPASTGGGGVPAQGLGVYPSMHWGRPRCVNRMRDRCKNIIFATSLRTVKMTDLVFRTGSTP